MQLTEVKKKLIIILGMHRSGTSAITRGLQVFDIDIGNTFIPPAEDNEKGFWEDADINSFNIELMNAINTDWHHLTPINALDIEALISKGYSLRATELVRKKIGENSSFGFKDPRIVKLLPFWKDVFNHCEYDVSFILIIRHPISVVKSLAKRNLFQAEKTYQLWIDYVTCGLAGTIGTKKIIIDYDQLVNYPEQELKKISDNLELKINPNELEKYKAEFLDQKLRHTNYKPNDLKLDEACPPLADEIYTYLLKVASGYISINDSEIQHQIDNWTNELTRNKSLLTLIDKLFKQVDTLSLNVNERDTIVDNLTQTIAERDTIVDNLTQTIAERDTIVDNLTQTIASHNTQITHIFKSTSWKITYPFRIISHQIKRIYAAYRFGIVLTKTSGGSLALLRRTISILHKDGITGVLLRVKNTINYYKATGILPLTPSYSIGDTAETIDASIMTRGPIISIIIPVYNTPANMLDDAIKSVLTQTYKKWELIIIDDNSKNNDTHEILKKYTSSDKRIKINIRKENGNISKAINDGINLVKGEFFTVLDHDDTIDKNALYWIAHSIVNNPSCDYIYSDEDKLTKDGEIYYGPFYKPDWSPEYILTFMYTCHLSVYRTSIIKDIGGYRSEFDGAQDFDLMLRVLNKTNNIFHIPRVLYHWRVWEQSTAQSIDAKPYAQVRARQALVEFLDTQNEHYTINDGPLPGHHRVSFLPKGNPLVSIVIPTANGSITINNNLEWHINAVITTIIEKTNYTNYELIIIHNGNLREEQIEYFSDKKNITLIHYNSPTFSLSEKINLGCKHSKGEYLVIMNDDIRVISENWLNLMIGMAQRDGVGAVGPKLLFPDDTIQHAGVVLLGGLPGHAYYQWPKKSEGYALGAKVNRNYIAITGACAMTPKWLFDKVGGYSDRYPLNYNDVDYCLKLHQLGYRSVYLADVELYHYEGVSKDGGRSVSPLEIKQFLADWGDTYKHDPYYNPNLSQSAPYQFG